MKGIAWNFFILEASALPTPTVKLLKSCEFHTFSIALDAPAILTAQSKTMNIGKKNFIYIYIYIYIYIVDCSGGTRAPHPTFQKHENESHTYCVVLEAPAPSFQYPEKRKCLECNTFSEFWKAALPQHHPNLWKSR